MEGVAADTNESYFNLKNQMRHRSLSSFILLFCLSLALLGCDRIPEEGTIVYDVDFPRADSDEAQGGSGSGSGTGGSGGGGGTTGSGSGSGGYDPDNSSIGYTLTESGGSTDIIEGTTDTFDIVLNSAPTDNITITVTTPNTGDVLISNAGGSLSPDNTTLTLTFTPLNWNTPQSVTVTGVEDATDEGGGTTAVNLTVSLTASLDTDWVPADIPDSTITANLTDSQATGPPSQITDLAVTDNGTQTITLGWTAASGAANQILYWSTTSPVTASADNFTLSGTATSYVHGGLTAGTAYYYMIVPTNGLGSASPSNEVSGTPSSFTGCNTSGTLTDTDPDLLVHYPFSNSLADVKNLGTTGSPYTLTNVTSWKSVSVSGSVKYAQGCAYGQAAYFDSTTGYLVNEDFDNASISALNDNYTISMWLYPETSNDNSTARHAILSGYDSGGPDFQLEYRESTSVFEWNAVEKIKNSPYPANQWYHVALVKHDNGTGSTYVNGALASSINNHSTAWDLIGMGISRSRGTEGHWKGYIDEVKVYGRAFTADNVTNACLLYQECEKYVKPATPIGLTATNPGSGTSINLTWNTVTGADNYTVYWTDDPSTPIDPSTPSTYDGFKTVTGTSTNATGLTNGTNYDFTVVATNTAGSSAPATEVNATPTLVMPAAIDNVTAYHGFYGDATIYTASNPDSYYIFPPSYAITWNAHPDFVYSANGDYYKVFISDNLSQPIDPTDNNTYISQSWVTTNKAIIQTRPFMTINGVTQNDGFLENTPIRIAVVFEDDSKGDILSPVTEATPTMASEAYREWGDLRIHGGFFAAGDNSTLYGFGRSNGGDPIRIEHKDMVNVGERAIFDGAWLKSDVFPLMGNSAGYDFMFLTWYQPEKPAFNHNFSTNGTYFKRSRTSGWRLESNTISPNSICGASNAEDCDFAMELQAEDTVGLIIQNSDGRQYKGSGIGYTNTGSGTLNGPTDYAANDYTTWSAGNGRYTKEHTGSSHWLDNSSYAGMTLFSTKNMYQINLANADAAISKVAIPFPPPDNLSVSTSGSNINLSWDNSTALTNTYSIYRSTDNSTWSLVTTLSGYDNNTYTDSSLSDGTYYYKIGANGTYYTSDNSTVASGVIATTPNVTLGIDNATITEGDSGSQTRTLTAALDRVATSTVTVNLSLNTSGTCTANVSDYSVSSPITINSGQSQATSNVTVYGDTTVEDNETACIDVSSVTNATEDGTQQARLTIINDDLAAPALDNATPAEQQNTIYWQAYSNASSYTLYWKTSSGVSTSDDNITISDNSSTSYIHGGLDNGTTYYYKLVANTASGSSALSNEVSGVPTAYDSCTTSGILADNDTDLLVYYPFNGNLNDEKNSHGDGRYNLTNSGGTIRFPQGCSYGLAGYFNTTSGYAYNDNFTDSNVGGALAAGNYTITMWVNADADMPKFASALNTGFKNQMSPTGWQNKSQIDIDGNGRIEWLTANNSGSNNDITGSSSFPLHQWHHLAAVHYDNDTAQLYSNGTLLESTNSFPAKWYGLVVGVNRANNPETRTWKGYIDEVKVYGRPFSYNDVIEKCGAYAECLVPPANLAATAAAYQNTLSWTAVNGASGYKIYWDTNANVTTSDSSITISDNSSTSYVHSSLTAGQTYYYRIVTIKDSESALSNEVSGTTPPPPSAVSNLAATSGYQQVKLTWSNVAGADNYTLFWALNDPFTSPFTVTNGSNSIEGVSSGFIHGGLTSGKRYEYALQVVDNGVSSALSNQVNGTPTGETTVTLPADNNTDLVVYYDFDGDLNNKASTGAAYNLTAAGDAGFVYAGSRFTGDQASYFDSRGGYAYNDNFTDNGSGRVSAYGIPELQDNFTVSMWLRPDEDMSTYASALTSSDGTGGSSSGRFQISDNGSGGIVAITNNRDKWQTNAQLTLNSWSHVVAVKYDNGTLRMYKDGTAGANEVFIATSFNPLALRPASDNETSFTTEWHKIKIGINRVSQSPWKGYVDEVKIYKKSLTPTEVGYLYNNHCPKVSCP